MRVGIAADHAGFALKKVISAIKFKTYTVRATLRGRQKSVRRCGPSRSIDSGAASGSRFSARTHGCLLTPISCAG